MNAIERERARCIAAVEAEPEMPGPMPDELWDVIRSGRHVAVDVLRIAVRQTKAGIIARILTPDAKASGGGAPP